MVPSLVDPCLPHRDRQLASQPQRAPPQVFLRAADSLDSTRARRDGTTLDVSIAVASIIDGNGKVSAVAKTIRDISLRKASEFALRQNNLLLEAQVSLRSGELQSVQRDLATILDALPSVIGYWDKNLINRFANRAYCQLYGADPAQVPGMSMRELMGDKLFEQSKPRLDIVLGGSIANYERVMPGANGGPPSYLLAHLIPDLVDHEVQGFYVLAHDITERKELELKQIASEQRYRLVVEDQTEMISLADVDGKLSFVNQAYAALFDREAGEMIGTSLYDYVPASGREAVRQHLQNVCSCAGAVSDENWLLTASGEQRWIAWTNRALSDADGVVTAIHSVGRDITERRLAETALRESEQRLQMVTDNIPGLISHLDRDLRFRFVNRAYGTWFNVDPQSLIGMRVRDFYGEAGYAVIAEPLQAALNGASITDEREVVANGVVYHCHVVLIPQRDANGEVIGLFVIHTDITERRHAEIALRDSESLLARTGAMAGVGGWQLELATQTITWSDETKRIHDVGMDYVPTMEEALRFYSPASRIRIEEHVRECIEQLTPYDVELELISAKGRVFWARATGSPEVKNGQVVRLVGAFQDITERRMSAHKLLEVSSLLSLVLDSSSEVSLIAGDANLNITVFNAGAERLLGYTADEVIGHATPALFHDPDEIQLYGDFLSLRLGRTIQGPGVFTEPSTLRKPREWTYIRKDGERVAVSLIVTPMYADGGDLLGYLGVAHDITHRAQYEESLRAAMNHAEKANTAKSEFLANMSHEIRTPLNAVIGLGYLLEQTRLSEDQRQFLNKIQFASRALLGVINNVLDLSKIEAGEMSLEQEVFDLPGLVSDLSEMLAPQAAAKRIKLRVPAMVGIPQTVKGDALRLRQILMNLLSNSIKFTEVGHVELRISCTDPSATPMLLRCEVEDSGIGIAADALQRLFTPFTQADASTTRRFGGTGLGLSIAHRFIDLMGGQIGVDSAIGVGTTFWFEVPLHLASRQDVGVTLEGLRILIADSAADVSGGLGDMVRALGLDPQCVETGRQFLRILDACAPALWPNVLVVEKQLADMDAQHLIARVKKECKLSQLPPVIVITDRAVTELEQERELLSRTADIVLARPVTSSALFNAMNAIVAKRRTGYGAGRAGTSERRDAQRLASVRVLVVDDSDINRDVARGILEKQGAIVTACGDGQTAFEHVRDHGDELDIVLMDVQMPILDGNEATRRIRQELGLQRLPIVALTAGALVAERQRSMEAGMNDFVSKPFEPQALIDRVRHLVEVARGEHIDTVIVAQPLITSDDEPSIPSIDAGVVKQMFGGDLSLFKSLLSRVLREYADLALPLSAPWTHPDACRHLTARMHKLKGSAGMIGASEVTRHASAAELALRDERPAQVTEGILDQLAAALTTLSEEAAPYLSTTPNAPDVNPAQRSVAVTDIDELCALLESQNLAAVDKFAELADWLGDAMPDCDFQLLRSAVDDLDFPLGADLLRSARLAG